MPIKEKDVYEKINKLVKNILKNLLKNFFETAKILPVWILKYGHNKARERR